MELLTALGYKDNISAPFVLLGANLRETGKGSSVMLHLSNVLTPNADQSTTTVGVEAELWRMQPLVYYASLKGSTFLRQQGDVLGRTATLVGQGSFGSVTGTVSLGYVERQMATFPWENEDAANGITEDQPYYYLQTAVAASVKHEWGLKWSQDVTFRRLVGESGYRLGISTGPEITLGPGALTVQGGFVFGLDSIRPMGQLRFTIRDPYEGKMELRISAATTSLGRDVPVYQGWYSYDADGWRLQSLVRLEHPIDGKPNPTFYLSVAPKF